LALIKKADSKAAYKLFLKFIKNVFRLPDGEQTNNMEAI
jgi:hypothetical protein